MFGALATCCDYSPDNGGGGITGGGASGKAGAAGSVTVGTGAPRSAGDLVQRIAAALQDAIHGDGSGGGVASGSNVVPFPGRGLNPVPFPMVNPFKPVVKTRSPVTALTAFPKRFTYSVPQGDGEPDDEQTGFSGLGYSWADFNPSYPESTISSGPSKLQTIVGGIAATLPATVQAFRAAPGNIYPTSGYSLYGSNAGGAYPNQSPGADIGARTGAAVGNVGDTIGSIVQQHPLLVLGGGIALLLLFMNPPRRR